jgi:oligoendopeptidase F
VSRSLPSRLQVDRRFTWNSESVFPNSGAWDAAVAAILSGLPDLSEFKGHLSDSPDTLADWYEAAEKLQRLMGKVQVYTTMEY